MRLIPSAVVVICALFTAGQIQAGEVPTADGKLRIIVFGAHPDDAELTSGGTLLRMEQSGFSPDQEANYKGANYGWQKFIGNMERVVAKLQ